MQPFFDFSPQFGRALCHTLFERLIEIADLLFSSLALGNVLERSQNMKRISFSVADGGNGAGNPDNLTVFTDVTLFERNGRLPIEDFLFVLFCDSRVVWISDVEGRAVE